KVARGYLGVEVQEVTPAIASALGVGDAKAKGALVASVSKDGPGAKAGLQAGDLIQTFDGKTVEDMHALPRLVGATPSGKTVEIGVLRQGKTVDVKATIDTLTDEKIASAEQPGAATHAGALGVSLAPLTPDARQRLGLGDAATGVLIARVAQNSPAAMAGLRAGDIIERVDGAPVNDPAQAKQAIDAAKSGDKPVLLLLNSHGAERFVAVREGDQG
ncbi:MAG TPA: PDZ domain-containing protein, partial [Stellaceae bacterium]|nr:PDZ domain-containing protein [Stellaceae bacterium]